MLCCIVRSIVLAHLGRSKGSGRTAYVWSQWQLEQTTAVYGAKKQKNALSAYLLIVPYGRSHHNAVKKNGVRVCARPQLCGRALAINSLRLLL